MGAALGAVDAVLGGYPVKSGIAAGAAGGLIAPLIPLKLGLGLAIYGVADALWRGNYSSALFRAASSGFGSFLQWRGFPTFRAFKNFYGPAGQGRAWHHIVEQTPGNVARFGAQRLHTANNMVPLDHGGGTLHARLGGFYSSKQPNITRSPTLTIRAWLSNKSFQEQYRFGLEAMKSLGGPSGSIEVGGAFSSWTWPAVLAPFTDDRSFGQDSEDP